MSALAPQQFAVDVGDLLQLLFQLVVVFDPAADFIHFFLRDDAARGAARSERDGQIPGGSVPLAARALTGWIPAGHIALHQRPPQNLGHRRQFRQTLPALRRANSERRLSSLLAFT